MGKQIHVHVHRKTKDAEGYSKEANSALERAKEAQFAIQRLERGIEQLKKAAALYKAGKYESARAAEVVAEEHIETGAASV